MVKLFSEQLEQKTVANLWIVMMNEKQLANFHIDTIAEVSVISDHK